MSDGSQGQAGGGFLAALLRILRQALLAGLAAAARNGSKGTSTRTRSSTTRRTTTRRTTVKKASTGSRAATSSDGQSSSGRTLPDPATLNLTYDPQDDDSPDPGEIVWTWVAYEEDDGRGKDRPVLVIARRRGTSRVVGLMLTSKDHDRDAADEHRHGRYWLDVGSGDWDSQRRPSEIRLDRLIDVDPAQVRRETALDRARFDQVVTAFRALHGA